MEHKLPTTSYAILGMLSLSPMSGYELAQNVDRSIAHFWTISKSQVYSELSRLEELGLVGGTDVAQERVPDKRIYGLTEEGSDALDAWLRISSGSTRLRSSHLLKMFFAHRMSDEHARQLLDRYRAEADEYRAVLRTIVELLDGLPEAYFTRATALVGLRSAEGTIAALDEISANIPASTRSRAPVRLDGATKEGFGRLSKRTSKGRRA